MAAKIGLWLDRQEAVIVSVTNIYEETIKVISNIEENQGNLSPGRLSSPEARQTSIVNGTKRRLNKCLDSYYNGIIDNIWNAGAILIYGSGEAKYELKNHLEKNNLAQLIVSFEDADKMADDQIMANVRKYSPRNLDAAKYATESSRLPEATLPAQTMFS